MREPAIIRRALSQALPLTTSNYGESPNRALVYVPPAHLKALRIECNLVIGVRGVGKSFWASALASQNVREWLGLSVSELVHTDVSTGFSVRPDLDAYPDGDSLLARLKDGATPYSVWRGVIARWLSKVVGDPCPGESWQETIAYIDSQPEAFTRLLQRASQHFASQRRNGLVVFDALDRTSSDWQTMDGIVRDLLRVVLLLKAQPHLSGKVFLREDQFDRTTTDFPDASKLLATRVDLTWAGHDLHGLLWQLLCNAPNEHGRTLRAVYERTTGRSPLEEKGSWRPADDVKRESATQRSLFEALAGRWMGRDRRRGVPYVWAVSHLADGHGLTSPRSFVAAIHAAAVDSEERYPDHDLPLHHESIKRGVQKASEIRVSEMAEDYPWVPTLFEPLRGLSVPCQLGQMNDRWTSRFPGGPRTLSSDRLPPQHSDEGWARIPAELERLGIFRTMRDGRINLPDLYRIGFGLGRRGGVRPVGSSR